MQAYLAAGLAADQLVTDAGLGWRDDKRIRFAQENLVDALSPSNVPLLNPASAKAAIDTGGMNLVRGGISLLRDLASPPRVPEMVDKSAFGVGRNVAVTPGAVVLRTEQFEFIQYRPQTGQVREVPLLVVPPTINKYYALDLAPGRSLVEYLVQNGQQVFVISWRNPDARHAAWGLDTYVQAVLDALDAAQRVCGVDRAALIGTCAGGIIASVCAAHLAAIGQQERLAAFGLLVTVLDTAQAGTVGALADRGLASAAKVMSGAPRLPRRPRPRRGVRLAAPRRPDLELLGEQLPARQEAARVRHLVLERRHHPDDRPAACRLRGPGDGQQAHHARSADGARHPVDLSRVGTTPTSSPGIADHITPWQNCYRSTQLLGGQSRFILSTSGHIAALVNPPGSPKATYQTSKTNPASGGGLAEDRQPNRAAGGRTCCRGSATAAARRSQHQQNSAAAGYGRSPRPGTYVFDT